MIFYKLQKKSFENKFTQTFGFNTLTFNICVKELLCVQHFLVQSTFLASQNKVMDAIKMSFFRIISFNSIFINHFWCLRGKSETLKKKVYKL